MNPSKLHQKRVWKVEDSLLNHFSERNRMCANINLEVKEQRFYINLLIQIASTAAAKLLQSCLTLCDPIDGSPPGSPSLGFSRPEHWSGLPFPSPMHESEK